MSSGRRSDPGSSGPGEQAPDAGGRVALEDQSRPHPHHPHARLLEPRSGRAGARPPPCRGSRRTTECRWWASPRRPGGPWAPARRPPPTRRTRATWRPRPRRHGTPAGCPPRSPARWPADRAPAGSARPGAPRRRLRRTPAPAAQRATSAARHSTLGKRMPGMRRATPTTLSTAGSSASALSTLVPTLPLAPVTTTRMGRSDAPTHPSANARPRATISGPWVISTCTRTTTAPTAAGCPWRSR